MLLQVVGGVALSASYYQHVLATEGRSEQVPPCQLLISARRRQELLLLPATQARPLQAARQTSAWWAWCACP